MQALRNRQELKFCNPFQYSPLNLTSNIIVTIFSRSPKIIITTLMKRSFDSLPQNTNTSNKSITSSVNYFKPRTHILNNHISDTEIWSKFFFFHKNYNNTAQSPEIQSKSRRNKAREPKMCTCPNGHTTINRHKTRNTQKSWKNEQRKKTSTLKNVRVSTENNAERKPQKGCAFRKPTLRRMLAALAANRTFYKRRNFHGRIYLLNILKLLQ